MAGVVDSRGTQRVDNPFLSYLFAVLVGSRLLSCRLSLKLATAAFIASDDVIE